MFRWIIHCVISLAVWFLLLYLLQQLILQTTALIMNHRSFEEMVDKSRELDREVIEARFRIIEIEMERMNKVK